MRTNTCSTELNRIKSIKPYDAALFNKLYKLCTPLMRRLARNIDSRRLNVSPDIIESYFIDKFLFIFNKYQVDYDEEHLKATLLSGLKKYSYRLMRECYSGQAEFNQTLVSFEVLFDDSKEDEDVDEKLNLVHEEGDPVSFGEQLKDFLKVRLSDDEFLIYQLMIDPPPFLQTRIEESRGKLSILHLIDYFEFPRSRRAYHYFNMMRSKIIHTLEEAKAEFGGLVPNPTMASHHSEEDGLED